LLLAVTGERINRIDIGTRRILSPVEVGFRVNCLAIEDYSGLIVVGGYWTIAVYDVSGRPIARGSVESSVASVATPDIPESVPGRFFVTGHACGVVRFWGIDYREMALVPMLAVRLTSITIRKIAVEELSMRIVAISAKDLFVLDFAGSSAAKLRHAYAVECGVCAASFAQAGQVKICTHCHRFVCQACLMKESAGAGKDHKKKDICLNCGSPNADTM
jgi:hypothetical protein